MEALGQAWDLLEKLCLWLVVCLTLFHLLLYWGQNDPDWLFHINTAHRFAESKWYKNQRMVNNLLRNHMYCTWDWSCSFSKEKWRFLILQDMEINCNVIQLYLFLAISYSWGPQGPNVCKIYQSFFTHNHIHVCMKHAPEIITTVMLMC